MKKILLTLAIAITANFSYAQRSIDWSVETILSPSQVVHNTSTALKIVCKNNGTDTAEIGDTIFTRAILNNQFVTNYVIQVLTARLNPGDTIHHSFNINGIPHTTLSFNGPFMAQSVLQNRPGLTLEAQGTITNNSVQITIPYINDKGWGVSVNSVADNSVMSLYPNPAKTELNVDVKMLGNSDATLEIIDMTGKVVMSINGYNAASGFNVNVEGFDKGVYLVQVKNGDFVSTAKISIN